MEYFKELPKRIIFTIVCILFAPIMAAVMFVMAGLALLPFVKIKQITEQTKE